MLLNRTIRHFKPRSARFRPQLVFNSTKAAVRERGDHPWNPFNQGTLGKNKANHILNSEYDAMFIAMQKKRKIRGDHPKGRKLTNAALPKEGTNEEVLAFEVQELLSYLSSNSANDSPQDGDSETPEEKQKIEGNQRSALKMFTEYEVEIVSLSSTGDGLAYSPSKDQVIVVPFTAPGDVVISKPHKEMGLFVHADLVKIVKPSPQREGVTPKCKYFGDCSGCQLQMLSYDDQLKHKKTIVEKAFKHFSGLSTEKIPPVGDTMGSPLQYEYRTKLSPHFSVPRSVKKTGRPLTEVPPIGYNRKAKKYGEAVVMDIEECPIGTPVVQAGLKVERANIAATISKFVNGKTILLREDTKRTPTTGPAQQDGTLTTTLDFDSPPTTQELTTSSTGNPIQKITFQTHVEEKTYKTNENETTTEYIGPYKFANRAGSFFQNNNSILRSFTNYIYENYTAKPSPPSPSQDGNNGASDKPTPQPIKYLLDAYCGSGLFSITLSPLFSSALGIDVDPKGIEAARQNATLNSINNAGFLEADATDLFADVPFPPDQSLVIIDPPRKGASKDFLEQLCVFGAKRVVYVSCNVHTQARDVGMIVNGFDKGVRYEIESLRGFDFFPQTGHVEGVCILNRVDG